MKDGWHTIQGRRVYIEDGMILRAIKLDHNSSEVPAHVYRASKYGGWDSTGKITVAAFSAGVRRGTIDIF